MILLLNREDVKQVLHMKECMDVVEQAFAELTRGSADLPLRANIKPPEGLSLYMPAYLKDLGALACKVVKVYKNNPQKHGLPTILGKVLLQDPETGDVICVMDGGYLTAVRTGAASGIATKYLAREGDNQVAAIYGAGGQAVKQLEAVAVARQLSKALVYDVSAENAKKFVQEAGTALNLEIIQATDPEELLAADIICTATSSPTPIFNGANVKAGTHINGIGSHTPNARELDTEIIKRSKFIGDSREACFNEAGDIMIPLQEGAIDESHFYAELGQVITGAKEGRINNQEITLFKSNGLAIQDAATAKLVYDRALAAGIGQKVDI